MKFVFVLVLLFATFAYADQNRQANESDDFQRAMDSLVTQFGQETIKAKASIALEYCDTYAELRSSGNRALPRHLEELRRQLAPGTEKSKEAARSAVFDEAMEALVTQFGQEVVDANAAVAQEYCITYAQLIKTYSENGLLDFSIRRDLKEMRETIASRDLFAETMESLVTEFGEGVVKAKASIAQEYCDTYAELRQGDVSSVYLLRLDSLRERLNSSE